MRLVVVMLAISLFLACTDTGAPPRKKYKYSVIISNSIVAECQHYYTNGGSETGVILTDCKASNGISVPRILNAVNVIVEEIK